MAHSTLKEGLADKQHEIWSHWMRYLFSVSTWNEDGSVTIPADKVERWQRQMETPYAELTEQEKDSDREQAHKILGVIVPLLLIEFDTVTDLENDQARPAPDHQAALSLD